MANDDGIKSDIIHGRPPNRGHFPKGKSGNALGRPKKRKETPPTDSTVRDEFLKAAGSLMKLTENGKEVSITQSQAVDRAQFFAAVKAGSSHAQRNYQARHAHFLRELAEEIYEDHQWWRRYVDAYDLVTKDYADRGEKLPDYYPHPDELNFTEGKKVTGWMGSEPFQAAALRAHYIRVRDVFLMQAEKDRRHSGSKWELDHISGTMGLFINALLPKAVQFDEVTLIFFMSKQRALRKRELQRRLAEAWAAVGSPESARMTTPPLDEAARKRAFAALRERFGVRESTSSGEVIMRGQPDSA